MNKDDIMAKTKEQMKIIQEKTGIDPKIILGILGVAALFTLIGLFDKYITCLVAIGVLKPLRQKKETMISNG